MKHSVLPVLPQTLPQVQLCRQAQQAEQRCGVALASATLPAGLGLMPLARPNEATRPPTWHADRHEPRKPQVLAGCVHVPCQCHRHLWLHTIFALFAAGVDLHKHRQRRPACGQAGGGRAAEVRRLGRGGKGGCGAGRPRHTRGTRLANTSAQCIKLQTRQAPPAVPILRARSPSSKCRWQAGREAEAEAEAAKAELDSPRAPTAASSLLASFSLSTVSTMARLGTPSTSACTQHAQRALPLSLPVCRSVHICVRRGGPLRAAALQFACDPFAST